MADTYSSREARRKAAIAEALMQGAMTPTQGQMVGRYYVGEGIGNGLARIGQALLAKRLNTQADTAEDQYKTDLANKRAQSFQDLVTAINPQEVTDKQYDGDLSGLSLTHTKTPRPQDIGAALLKYQQDTGQEVSKDVLGLLSPTAGGGVEAFGTTIRKDNHTYQLTRSGKLIDLGEGFDEPTRVLDLGNKMVVTPTSGMPKPIAEFGKGVSTDLVFKTNVEPQVAAAVEQAKAGAGLATEGAKKVSDAETAIDLLGRYINAVQRQPDSAFGRGMESALGVVNAGNKEQQDALAEAENLGAQLLTYAQKQPGPSSDKDVQNYQTQVGKLSDWKATKAQRIKAAKAALESYNRIIQKYGADWKPNQPTKQANPFD